MQKLYITLAMSIWLAACSSSSNDNGLEAPMDGNTTDESGEAIDEPVVDGMTDAESDPTGVEGPLRNNGTQLEPTDVWHCNEFRALGFYNDGNGLFGVLEGDELSVTETLYSVDDITGNVTFDIVANSQQFQLSTPQFADNNTFDTVITDTSSNSNTTNFNCVRVTL